MIPVTTKRDAVKRQVGHQFVPGIGYIVHAGPPELPTSYQGSKNCDPPPDTADGSVHLMRPSHGAAVMPMRWVASERAWAALDPGRGNRMAWPIDHLSRAGWEYVGPEEPLEQPKKRGRR